MTFDAFLEAAWDDHGDRPTEVAERLAASLQILESPAQIAPFAQLATHVYGEHLGRWQDGIRLLESLRGLPVFDGAPALAGALDRGIATLGYAAGDHAALASLCADDRAAVLASASSAFAGRGEFRRAIAAYAEALACARADLPSTSPAARALAVGGNNLAASLEQKPDRAPRETQAMVAAAERALVYWKLAGTWLEEERAQYRIARSQLQAGDAASAVQSARRCLHICECNKAPAVERVCAHAVHAAAQREAGDVAAFEASCNHALALFGLLPPEARQGCETEVEELRRQHREPVDRIREQP